MDHTDRLNLTFLAPGQGQKELWINENLLVLDMLIGGEMDSELSASPPLEAISGRWYRIAPTPDGEWTGRDGQIAAKTGAGWRFVRPFSGLALRDATSGKLWRFADGNWQAGIEHVEEIRIAGQRVLGPRQAAIPNPTAGTTVDEESRAAINAVLATLRTHGLTA